MRHVRTKEGVKRFNLPLGAPITAEAILRAKSNRSSGKSGGSAAKPSSSGGKAPAQSAAAPKKVPGPSKPEMIANAEKMYGTGSKEHKEAQRRFGGTGRRSAAPASARSSRPAAPAPSSNISQESTLTGDHKIEVGSKEYRLSAEATVRAPKTGDKAIAYVTDPQDDNDLHVLTESGEVPVSEPTKAAVLDKIEEDPSRFSTIKPVPVEGSSKDAPTDAEKPASGRRAADTGNSAQGRRAALGGPSNAEMLANAEKMYGTGSKEHKAAQTLFGDAAISPREKISQPKVHEQDGNTWDPADIGLSRNDAGMIERVPDSTGIAPTPAPDEIEAMQSSPYTSPHLNPDGTFTEERQALHEKIINDFLDGIEPSANPTQFMNGGGPASGKGGMTRGANAKLTNYPTSRSVDDHTGELEKGEAKALLIDPDAIKMQFPEVKEALGRLWGKDTEDNDFDKGWAGHSHEESSQLAKRLHTAALQRGIDIIYDGTGNGSVKSVKSKVAAARAAGYRVEANYLFLPPEQGIERAASRAARSKRVVPDMQIRKTYAAIPEIFDGIKDGTFDKVNLFDNRVEMNEPALHIGATGPDGKFQILDEKRYKEFMDSRNEAGIDKKTPAKKPDKTLQDDLQKTDSSRKANEISDSAKKSRRNGAN